MSFYISLRFLFSALLMATLAYWLPAQNLVTDFSTKIVLNELNGLLDGPQRLEFRLPLNAFHQTVSEVKTNREHTIGSAPNVLVFEWDEADTNNQVLVIDYKVELKPRLRFNYWSPEEPGFQDALLRAAILENPHEDPGYLKAGIEAATQEIAEVAHGFFEAPGVKRDSMTLSHEPLFIVKEELSPYQQLLLNLYATLQDRGYEVSLISGRHSRGYSSVYALQVLVVEIAGVNVVFDPINLMFVKVHDWGIRYYGQTLAHGKDEFVSCATLTNGTTNLDVNLLMKTNSRENTITQEVYACLPRIQDSLNKFTVCLDSLIKVYPNDATLRSRMVESLIHEDRFNEAILQIEQGIELAQNNFESSRMYQTLAKYYAETKQRKKAGRAMLTAHEYAWIIPTHLSQMRYNGMRNNSSLNKISQDLWRRGWTRRRPRMNITLDVIGG